ncbi:MAG: CHAT domain-containing protein [bacterium]
MYIILICREPFYRTARLRTTQKGSVAAALRKAQLELKKEPGLSHPFFWAPFQLIGDWR